MKNIVVHIPHASIQTPDIFKERLLVDRHRFEKENIFEADYLIDIFKPRDLVSLIPKYSRMFCDVERLKENEEMDKYGMGVIYKNDCHLKPYINLNDEHYKEYVMEYYNSHHLTLNNITKEIIDNYGYCIIVDLHSFSNEYVEELFNKDNCPDICIGFNEDDYDSETILYTIKHFESYGYTVKTNYPYAGSIVPSNYLDKKNNRISSIMIEVNKRVYLKDNYEMLDINKSNRLSKCMNELYKHYQDIGGKRSISNYSSNTWINWYNINERLIN